MMPIPIAIPDGTAKRATDFKEPFDSPRAELGASASTNGNSDRDRRGDRELARQQRKGRSGDRHRQPHHGDEHRLGDEELRDPLDVSQDLAPFGDHTRDDPEVVPHEHEIGDRARHLRPRALRDGEARLA